MDQLICKNVKDKLQLYIKGKISTHIVDGTLVVTIESNGITPFRYTISDIALKVCNGFTSYAIACEIAKKYRAYIFNKFFVK